MSREERGKNFLGLRKGYVLRSSYRKELDLLNVLAGFRGRDAERWRRNKEWGGGKG